ncbi:MAG: hypothetical protein Q8O29_19865 [Polaromonas sp.]|uniref:restriction endonuclease subunit S n=1 Tax=Polaromonas sp. TaxID=1869339 RepID=UPI002733FEA2|nr:hypothetical protein [Polaromonas sp.]MDP2820489.1 hypothetical protein [Polaromonas sp.]
MSFARYPSYKDSGVEWLGEVPGHWEIDRLKRSTVSAKNGIWGDEAQQDENDIPCVRVADFDRQGLRVELSEPTIRNVVQKERVGRVLQRGDLLLEKSGGGEGQPVGCVVLYDDPRPAVCSNFVARVQTAPSMDSSFWRYVHAAAYSVRLNTRSIKQTSGIQNLDASQYIDERAGFPPLSEQTQIAAFLDRETTKIDSLVAEQRRLMALLKENRQAVISHAVTQGLNPDAPMKPSGNKWLGDVPAHWEVCSIRRIVTAIEQGWSPECFSRPAEDEEWGVLKAGCVNRGIYDQNDNKALPAELAPMPEYEVQIGDVLMSRASGSPELVGSTALVTSTRKKLMLSDKIFRLRFERRMEPKFFVAALNSRPLRSQIEQALSGGNGLANNLPQASLRGFFLAVPPKLEQQEVCDYLESESSKLDTLTAEAQRAIALLQERRTALISAAVTGQIDVRGTAQSL